MIGILISTGLGVAGFMFLVLYGHESRIRRLERLAKRDLDQEANDRNR